MSGKQQAVMWLGVLLIAVRLVTTSQGRDIWQLIVTGPPPTAQTPGQTAPSNPYPSVPGLGKPGQGWQG